MENHSKSPSTLKRLLLISIGAAGVYAYSSGYLDMKTVKLEVEFRIDYREYEKSLVALMSSPPCKSFDLSVCKKNWEKLRRKLNSESHSLNFLRAVSDVNARAEQALLERNNEDSGTASGLSYRTHLIYESILQFRKSKEATAQNLVRYNCRALEGVFKNVTEKIPEANLETASALVRYVNEGRIKFAGACPILPEKIAQVSLTARSATGPSLNDQSLLVPTPNAQTPPAPNTQHGGSRSPSSASPAPSATAPDMIYRSAEALKLQRARKRASQKRK